MDNINSIKSLKIDDIDKNLKVFQIPIVVKNRPEFTNKVYKMLFFIIHEGLQKTFKKYFSKKIDATNSTIMLTVLIYKSGNNSYINISTQYTNSLNNFIIDNLFYKCKIDYTDNLVINENSVEKYNQFVGCDYSDFAIEMSDNISFEHINNNSCINLSTGVFLFGLGDYSRVYVAPHLKKLNRIACVDYNHNLAKFYAQKFDFKKFSLSINDILNDLSSIKKPLVIIATYHSSHVEIAREVFTKNKTALIFIEKPPCVTFSDLSSLINLYNSGAQIEIGFNRRFIPYNQYIKNQINGQKVFLSISIKEVLINKNHWYHWVNQGTRITGNLVHWIDLCIFFTASIPIEINLLTDESDSESLVLSILFKNGSLASILVTDEGSSLRGVQEKIEIRFDSETIFIDDYLKMSHTQVDGKVKKSNKIIRDKGHDSMYKHLINLYLNGGQALYPVRDVICTAVTTFYATELFRTGVRNKNIECEINKFISDITI